MKRLKYRLVLNKQEYAIVLQSLILHQAVQIKQYLEKVRRMELAAAFWICQA